MSVDLKAIQERAGQGRLGIEAEGGGSSGDAWQTCAEDIPALLERIEGLEAHVALLKASLKQATAAEEKVCVLEEALRACRSFLIDPEGTADVSISDTVWVRDGMTLLDLVDGALIHAAAALSPERMPSDG